jgi:type II secretory pathway pseudopilin PulG
MATLLVGMAVMAVLMSAALPVWSQQARREQEEEYLFRANQYARGVMLFQRKFANTFPPNVDVLVEQRFLRKKYKDPLTGEDFNPVMVTPQPAGAPGVGGAGGGAAGALGQPAGGPPVPTGGPTATTTGQPGRGALGLMGVVSKSKATSIRVWNGRTRYDQWAVTYQDVRPGRGLPPDLRAVTRGAAPGAVPGPGQPGAAGMPQQGFGRPVPGGVGNPGGGFGNGSGGRPGAAPAGRAPFQPVSATAPAR